MKAKGADVTATGVIATMDEYVKDYLARELKVSLTEIASFQFKAEPGGGYSEYTEWGFTCDVVVSLTSGEERRVYMGESDVASFLSGYPGGLDG